MEARPKISIPVRMNRHGEGRTAASGKCYPSQITRVLLLSILERLNRTKWTDQAWISNHKEN